MQKQMRRSNFLFAALTGRCPRCRRGAIFSSFWQTHDVCSVCDLQYEREAGFFLMSIFIAYLLDGIVLVPIGIAMFRADVSVVVSVLVCLAILLVITPFSYRYSRILWVHIDWLLDPRHRE